MIVWRIAIRNLREHKTKTVIVGVLIAVAMTLLVAGNSLMDSIGARMEANYRNTYTGDAVIRAQSDLNTSLFGIQGLDALNASVPVLPNYEAVVAALEESRAEHWSGLIQAQGIFLHNEEAAGFGTLWGVESVGYQAMFGRQIELIDGQFFAEREKGIVLSEEVIADIEEESGYRYAVGDTIRISANSESGGGRIRSVPVTGIFRIAGENPLLQTVSLLDEATARELSGLDVEPVAIEDLSEDEQALLGEVEEESLFGGGGLFGSGSESGEQDLVDVDNVLGEAGTARDADAAFDLDRWHFIVAQAPTAAAATPLLANLRSSLTDVSGVAVGDWQWAAGPSVTLVIGVQIIFNVIAIIISVVSIIIIVNTLVISISERIPEIGTIRAIGGKKRFVRKLITRETLVITGAFGVLGMILGSIIIGIVAAFGITAESTFLQLLLGGQIFRPGLSLGAIISSLAGVGLMAWIASLYPVHMATRISPVVAMQRG
ncbi:MAG: ABC transporter permease [Spirochaetales bacterium]